MKAENGMTATPVETIVSPCFLALLVKFTASEDCSREWLQTVVELVANANT